MTDFFAWRAVFEPETSGRLCMTLAHSLWVVALAAIAARVASSVRRRPSVEWSYLVHVVALVVSVGALPATYWTLGSRATKNVPVVANIAAVDTSAPELGGDVSLTPMRPAVVVEGATIEGGGEMARAKPQAAGDGSMAWRRLAPWVAGMYAIGVGAMLARLAMGVASAERVRRQARPIVAGAAAAALRQLVRQWNLRAAPALAHAEHVAIPTLVGLLKPTILLPGAALTGLTANELEMILAHELAHVRRRDMWVNLLQRLAEAVLFFNPALWYLSRRIAALREYCCDELACRARTATPSAARLDYATALLRVVELACANTGRSLELATLSAGGRSPSELRRRVARLLGEPLREPLGVPRGGFVALGALLLAITVAPAWLRSQTPAEAAALPAYPGATTEADVAVAAARERTFGLKLVPRILIRQRLTSGQVAEMTKAPERSLKKMFEACGQEFDATAWSGDTDVTLAWNLGQLLIRTESGEAGKFTQSYLWDGGNGWIAENSTNGRHVYRYGSMEKLLESMTQISGVYLPQYAAAGSRLPWGGPTVVLDEHSVGAELTRYKRTGTETVDGVPCDVYEGPQRMERVWIDKRTGLVKASSRSYVHVIRPDYITELVSEVAGRRFANDDEYRQWREKQPAEMKERIAAHWSAAHWVGSEVGNLMVFSDYREIVPGVQWPMHCERIVVHPEDKGVFKYYRNAIDVTETTTKFVMTEAASDVLPKDGDEVTDRRFWPSEPAFTYRWTAGMEERDVEAARTKKIEEKRAADEATRKINEAPINSVDDAIKILTDGPKTDPTMIWARAIKYLVDHKVEGLPAAIEQLDAETRDHAISKLAFALRAIGDGRAVPALIRAMPRTLLPGGGDYGLALEEDLELLRFMQMHDQTGKVRGDATFHYGRAFREVVSALQRLTGQKLGEMELNWVSDKGTANQRRLKKQQFHAAAQRWAQWWESEGHAAVDDPAYAKVNLPPLDVAVGTPLGHELPAGPTVRLMSGQTGGIVESAHGSKKRCFVDLDTQREAGWPAELGAIDQIGVDSPELLAWAAREGFDMVGITYTPPGEKEPLYCLKPLGMRAWKISPEEHKALDDAIEGKAPYPLSQPVELMIPQREVKPPPDPKYGGDAFLFVTREGTAGLLRLTAQVTEIGGGGAYSGDSQFSTSGFYLGVRLTFGVMNEEAR